jgi:thiamine pyrophosphokinase
MLRYAKKVKMTLYSNFSKVVCVKDQTFFKSIPNQTISIIAPDKDILITTSDLEYPLNEEKLLFSSQGISNLTSTGTSYSIKASNWVWVFENYLF